MMNASDNSLFKVAEDKFFLIGFMGSGKTHWGKIWAKKNTLAFFDLDELIEQREKRTITDIFEKEGEEHFRQKEMEALRGFENIRNSIIACGGGTPCFHENMKWMNENGTTVYLETTAEDIFDRVLEEQDKRPLIKKLNKAELMFFIEQKLKEREPFYKEARITINSKEADEASFSKKIMKNSAKKTR